MRASDSPARTATNAAPAGRRIACTARRFCSARSSPTSSSAFMSTASRGATSVRLVSPVGVAMIS